MNRIELVEELISKVEALPLMDDAALDAIRQRAALVIRKIFGEDSHYLKDLDAIPFSPQVYITSAGNGPLIRAWKSGQAKMLNLFRTLKEDLELTADAPKPVSAETSGGPRAFISYSWDSDDHRQWVRDLAAHLRADGIDAVLDQWETRLGDHLPKFMETAIQRSDYVLVICTSNYKTKSENRIGGVGYEGDIITGEIFTSQKRGKYIPILREGEWNDVVPIWLLGIKGVDLSGEFHEQRYQELVKHLTGQGPKAPPLEQLPPLMLPPQQPSSTPRPYSSKWEDIKITGIILEEVTNPTLDGTHGSALYTVPFRLSRRPPAVWAEIFISYWNHPPSYSFMHRPGIARIVGDKIILDGTTIEEVERYHIETLKLVLKETNEKMAQLEAEEQKREKEEIDGEQQHKDNVKDVSDRLDFE